MLFFGYRQTVLTFASKPLLTSVPNNALFSFGFDMINEREKYFHIDIGFSNFLTRTPPTCDMLTFTPRLLCEIAFTRSLQQLLTLYRHFVVICFMLSL